MPRLVQYATRRARSALDSIVPAGLDGLATIRPWIGPGTWSSSSGVGWNRVDRSVGTETTSIPSACRMLR